jgi:hypothetical protein
MKPRSALLARPYIGEDLNSGKQFSPSPPSKSSFKGMDMRTAGAPPKRRRRCDGIWRKTIESHS